MRTQNSTTSLNGHTRAQAVFMYQGVPGYYERRPMVADILGNERRADGWWLHIQPVDCNLDRWIPANKVLGYVWPCENGHASQPPNLSGLGAFLKAVAMVASVEDWKQRGRPQYEPTDPVEIAAIANACVCGNEHAYCTCPPKVEEWAE